MPRVPTADKIRGRDPVTARPGVSPPACLPVRVLPCPPARLAAPGARLAPPSRNPDRAGSAALGRTQGDSHHRQTLRHRQRDFIEAIAEAVINAGRRVSWFTLETLTATIGRAVVHGAIARTVQKITRADLIVPDVPSGR